MIRVKKIIPETGLSCLDSFTQLRIVISTESSREKSFTLLKRFLPSVEMTFERFSNILSGYIQDYIILKLNYY